MGRVAEALRRAGWSAQGQGAGDTSTIRDLTTFSGGEVILAPWDAGEAAAGDVSLVEPAATSLRAPRDEEPASLRLSFGNTVAERVVASPSMDSAAREQYSRLAVGLHQAQAERASKIVMVTSTLPREGKTLTAINLALTLSESYGREVLLIDADLRAPSIHDAFCLAPEPGLLHGLQGDWRRVQQRIHPHLVVLPAGRASNDPMGVLALDGMRQMLDEARKEFDWVLLDTPPMGILPDANFLAGLVDSIIVVVRAGKTRYDLVQQAVREIGQDRVFGIVLNGAEADATTYAPYYAAYKRPAGG